MSLKQHPAVVRHNEAAAIAADKRAEQIVYLRGKKVSWPTICTEVGVTRQTAQSLYRRERDRLRSMIAVEMADQVDEELEGLDDLESQANELRLTAKTHGEKLKAIHTCLQVKRQRADLLGLNAPERLAVLNMNGTATPAGVELSYAELDAMSDEELAAGLDQQRAIRALPETTASHDDDHEPDDGAPPELDIPDPGPHAVVGIDATAGDSDPEGEET